MAAQPEAQPQQIGLLQKIFGIEDEALAHVLYRIGMYLALDDADALLVAIATAVSVNDAGGEPLWLLLVGPSSGSKTETIRTQANLADRQLSDITLAGLLSARPNRPSTGVLADLGNGCNAYVTVSDLSSLLNRGGSGGGISGQQQSGVFEALRDIYDGAYTRTMDRVSPSWHGRVTLLAAVTPAIDQMRAHADALGPRWVYFRLRQLDPEQRKLVQQTVTSRKNVDENRAEVAELVAQVVEGARARVTDTAVADETIELVEHCANIATYGRATVPRDYRGEIDGAPHWEEPGRLTHQLLKLARSLTAMNVGEEAVQRIIRRAAISCMPTTRALAADLLAELDDDEWLTTNGLANRAGQNRKVMRKALEDWEAIGICEMRIKQTATAPVGIEDDEDHARHDTRAREWRLSPNFRELVRGVLVAEPESGEA